MSLRRVKEVCNNADGTTIFGLKRSPCQAYPFELYFNSDVCVIVFIFFHCLLYYLLRAHFPILLFACAYIIVLYSDVGRKLSINGYYFIFLAYTNVCSVTELT